MTDVTLGAKTPDVRRNFQSKTRSERR